MSPGGLLPSADHWLGQDEYGRDILSRLLYGARVSLSVAIIASLAAMVIGVTLGLVGGHFRGLAEIFTLRLVDTSCPSRRFCWRCSSPCSVPVP
ncbi:MAG: hypothetical protein R3D03_11110 [Geminicoccaceae bacterium]